MTVKSTDKLAWIHCKDGRALCARSKGNDAYYFPGGKREPGETDLEALRREVQEELSVGLKEHSVAPFGTFEAQAHGKAEGVRVRMTCYKADFEGELAPASEIEEIAWLAYADRDRLSEVGRIIFDTLYEMKLLE